MLSGVRQWSAGRLRRWTQVLKPLQDQALPMPDHPLSHGGQARHEGCSGPSRVMAQGQGPPPPLLCSSVPWLGRCREMRKGRASAPNIENLSAPIPRPISLSLPCASRPGFHFGMGLHLFFHLVLLESAAEEEFGVREAGVHLPLSRKVLLCSGRRGADSLSGSL